MPVDEVLDSSSRNADACVRTVDFPGLGKEAREHTR